MTLFALRETLHPIGPSRAPTRRAVIHPDTSVLWISDATGYGVVATRRIPRGTLVWVLDRLDTVVRHDEVLCFDAVRRVVLERYGYRLGGGDWVLCWDDARLIVESSQSSLRRVGRSGMVARYDLRPGDRLTIDSVEEAAEYELEELGVAARGVAQPLLASSIEGSEVEAWLSGSVPSTLDGSSGLSFWSAESRRPA